MEILDYLCKKARCDYLSDLCEPTINFKLENILRKSDFMRFPLENWEYAYYYIFRTPSGAHITERLYQQFMTALSAGNKKGKERR